ncbi:hypothetical protein U1Q18_018836 [Sarracenia purpurea var. burkii]
MAINGAETSGLLLVFMFLLFSFRTCSTGNESDLLLSIKSWIRDPLELESLPNWNFSLPFCLWKGIACDKSSHVTKIDLSEKNLSGKIPESIFHFPYIETIDLSNNQLSGGIPVNISSCSSLRYLNLSNNNLTGSLPIPKGSVSSLQVLDLSNNLLSGQIPQEIGLFSGLEFLDLGGNALVGRIPNSISNMTGLEFLTLASNQLRGRIPRELGLLKSLKWIYLGYNNLSGGIPAEIGELTSLNHLDLVYNNLTGEIPSSLGNLTDLRYIFLYLNKLSGSIPGSIFGLKKLISLDLSNNFLSGEVPELVIQLQNLEILHLFSNNFTGKIPNAVSSLPRLQVLQLWSNRFSGEIPKDLGKQNNLTVLDLSTNNLTGKIPETVCESRLLFKLILFSNSLEGEIPESLSHCTSLKRVRLQNNRLSGELSWEFTKLPLVYFLDLSSNNLSGPISGRTWDMPELQMLSLARNKFFGDLPESFGSKKLENLDLSENRFSGSIPVSFGNLSELMQLRINENKLSGNIPGELSLCKKLVSLNLSHNQLTGLIPASLSEMAVLSQLDLSMNQFSGEIPMELGKVESLVQVNISHNHFHGHLPSTGVFLTINSSAVAGNHLCGSDAATGLPPCKGVKTPVGWLFLTCLLVVLAGLAVAAFVIVFARQRKDSESMTVEIEEGIWEFQFFDSKVSRAIKIDDILSSMIEENVIYRGRRGVSYKGMSAMNNMQFVLKATNETNSVPARFWAEAAELGKLRHPNIARVFAMCRSKKGGFLVYEYIEGKKLSEVFRGLSWERRRKIAIGIAKALRYLHSCRLPAGILATHLSPDKIIVTGEDEPRLRLSLPGTIYTDTKILISSAYVAPETKEAEEISEKSDVYGLGLILIQLLTGRGPADADAELGVRDSVVDRARYCYSECHVDTWIDPTIRGDVIANHRNEIVETMNLALHCTAGDPMARPNAGDVVKTLESLITPSFCVLGRKCSSAILF